MPTGSVKNYTLEFKQSSAKLAAESEQPITHTAKDLGINENTLHGWIRKYASTKVTDKTQTHSLEQELIQLRKENAKLKQERDILKKATAYFASETR